MGITDIKRPSENLALASLDRMALVYFPAKSPSLEDMSAMRAHLLEAAARAPAGFGLVLVIPEQAGPPEGKVRDQAAEMFRAAGPRLKIVAAAMEGAGFAAAAKRSVLSLLVNFTLGGAAIKVFSATGPCCEWAVQQARLARVGSPPAIELEACVAAMRRAE